MDVTSVDREILNLNLQAQAFVKLLRISSVLTHYDSGCCGCSVPWTADCIVYCCLQLIAFAARWFFSKFPAAVKRVSRVSLLLSRNHSGRLMAPSVGWRFICLCLKLDFSWLPARNGHSKTNWRSYDVCCRKFGVLCCRNWRLMHDAIITQLRCSLLDYRRT